MSIIIIIRREHLTLVRSCVVTINRCKTIYTIIYSCTNRIFLTQHQVLSPSIVTTLSEIGYSLYLILAAFNVCHFLTVEDPSTLYHVIQSTNSFTSVVSKYAACLKKKYLGTKLPVKEKWPSSPCKRIIKLAVINKKYDLLKKESESVDKKHRKEKSMSLVSMDGLLEQKDGSTPKIVVVQGVPGIGKSTFAWKFCRQWAKGKICKQCDLVVLLRTREAAVNQATDLNKLFFFVDSDFSQQVYTEVTRSQGKNILFLIEGLDELPVSCLTNNTLFSKMLTGDLLPKATILVTTRPWAVHLLTEKFGDQISNLVEILGFENEDILRYASYAFAEQNTEFVQHLHSHPQLESVMHIPLNAAIVVKIYKQLRSSQQAFPLTLTQLYTALIKGLLIHYLNLASVSSEPKLESLNDLPGPMKTDFKQLCLLAFSGFTKTGVQLSFTHSEIASYQCLDSLGLMQCSPELSVDTGTTVTYSFLHSTIQDFLAAYHLSNQPAQVMELFVESHRKDYQCYMLFKFLAGLNSNALLHLKDSTISQISTIQLHWLFESQSPLAVKKYLGNSIVKYHSENATSLDLYALTYCICHSNCEWNLQINISNLMSVYSPDDANSGKITVLEVVDTNSSGLRTIFSLPKRLFSKLSVLRVSSTDNIDSAIYQALDSGLLPSIKELGFFDMNFSVTSVFTAMSISLTKLTCLEFQRSHLTYSDMKQITEYISLLGPSSQLKIHLNSNVYFNDSLQLLISGVPRFESLHALYIGCSGICQTDIEILSVALSRSPSLKYLDLYNCSVTGEGAELLANGLKENKTLVELNLAKNNINSNGAAALGLMLTINTSLEKLNLSENNLIGIEGSIRLIKAMEQNKTLQQLILPLECEPFKYESTSLEHIYEEIRVTFS